MTGKVSQLIVSMEVSPHPHEGQEFALKVCSDNILFFYEVIKSIADLQLINEGHYQLYSLVNTETGRMGQGFCLFLGL